MLPADLTMPVLRHDRIPQGHSFRRFRVTDRQLTHRRLHHDQLRLGVNEEILSTNTRWSQPVDATLYLKEEMCGGGTEISSRVYGGREDGVMGPLEVRRVAEGDWTGRPR